MMIKPHYQLQTVFPVDIQFDNAHDAWIANKRKLAYGMYRYICCATTKTGKPCGRPPEPDIDLCYIHRKTKPTPTVKPPSVLSQIYGLLRKQIAASMTHIPILDVIDETILIRSTPSISGSFDQLYDMLDYYKSLADITDDVQCNGLPTDANHMMLCLQLMLSFLDGMDELSKLETKRMSVIRIKARILTFNGYSDLTHMHTTLAKWKQTSGRMRDKIITVMLHLFECLDKCK